MTDQRNITAMFDHIAPHYDLLNHLLSFRIDTHWRHKTSKIVSSCHPTALLDVATGTADLAIQLAKDNPNATITGLDLSENMLKLGRQKIEKKGLSQRITLCLGNAEALPFPDDHFDAVTVAFGVRNFEHSVLGLREMLRVTKNGGLLAILEFAPPKKKLATLPYRLYSKQVLPKIGQIVSKNSTAYTYLPNSIEHFSSPDIFAKTLTSLGLTKIHQRPFSGGIAILFYGIVQKNGSSPQ